LKLRDSEIWLLEVDYQLIMQTLEKMSTGEDETAEQKREKVRQWKNGKS